MEVTAQKVTADHLRRDAYLYVRQSTYRQVSENQESTRRQYALKEQALALGWPAERIVVIDSDLGHSGASATDRPGFQRLVADVGMGRVGIVLGLEASRLARSSSDWSRLLEICALTETLLLDEDGLYEPGNFNDRLLLGLKGTMSEAELHFLKARMRGGLLNKARRGELQTRLPIGFVYTPDGQVALEPDQQVQEAIRCLFATFRRTGSALATVRAFRNQGLLFPRTTVGGPHNGEVRWEQVTHDMVISVLRNPRYAGTFFFGRQQVRKTPTGQRRRTLERQDWIAFFPDSHPGYISLAEYEQNRRRLQANATAPADRPHATPPREGAALLQGLVICGRCGRRMNVQYQGWHHRPRYICQGEARNGGSACQSFEGGSIETAVGKIVVESFSPLALEVALSVQQELDNRAAEVDRLRRQQVERMRYATELAQRRYMSVDPNNRLVAAQLEKEWNQALANLRTAEGDYEEQRQANQLTLGNEQKAQILGLATDFPKLWNDPNTSPRDRKRLLRLLVEDVTLLRGREITVHIRFRGGACQTLTLPRPLKAPELYRTPDAIRQEIDRLLDDHIEPEVAEILNAQGLRSTHGGLFTAHKVHDIAQDFGLMTRYERLRARGLLSLHELATELNVSYHTAWRWYHAGLFTAHLANGNGMYLFERPASPPMKRSWKHQGHRPMSPPSPADVHRPMSGEEVIDDALLR